jgi:hypothetical protein
MAKVTFEAWMKKVDVALVNICGLDHRDIEDACWWDLWDDGYTPKAAAKQVLEDMGY